MAGHEDGAGPSGTATWMICQYAAAAPINEDNLTSPVRHDIEDRWVELRCSATLLGIVSEQQRPIIRGGEADLEACPARFEESCHLSKTS